MPLIAIDGPAGSGKSTVARQLARQLGVDHLDTGAMYRAVAFAALRDGIDPADGAAVAELAMAVVIEVDHDKVVVDGADATAEIRGPQVSLAVSAVAQNPVVRRELVERQRRWVAARGSAVVEGRDIGSVVLPEADVKVYLTASDSERARRRSGEAGQPAHAEVAADLARRDHVDSSRSASPLVVAEGAVVIDTTGFTVDEIVDQVLSRL